MSDTGTPARPNRPSKGSPPALHDLVGKTLDDFHVERLLGQGGMGEVYLARQISLDRKVALKVLRAEMLSNPTYLARFEKEALSVARLSHPNIVHVYALGQFQGLKYIAMEYVEGTNLKDFLARKGVPELNLAISIMRQAVSAIAAAGEIGLVHRDIKPENLLLTRKAQVKVADFGLCRTSAVGVPDLTREGVTLGTPMYMSPEQVQGRELDHRSDLYSLGVTFYHMLAGEPPFKAESALATALKHVQERPVNLAVHRPDLPAELVQLVMKLMAKDPAQRYPSAHEVLKDLQRLREKLGSQATQAAINLTQTIETSALAASSPPVAMATDEETDGLIASAASLATEPQAGKTVEGEPSGGGRRWLWAALLCAAAILLGGFTGMQARSRNLLSARAPQPVGVPGLWMDGWQQVAPRQTPQAQYRYALFQAPESERAAAWLAVPGNFPTAMDWCVKAYIQLARTLFRQRDTVRLDGLGRDLARQEDASLVALARVCQAGAAALQRQPDEVLAIFQGEQFELQDPALNELSYEVAEVARQAARQTTGAQIDPLADRLDRLREQLHAALQVGPLIQMGLLRELALPPS